MLETLGPASLSSIVSHNMTTPNPSTQPRPAKFPTFAAWAPYVGRWLMRCVTVAFGVAVLYFLSFGPAVQLNKRGLISPTTLEKLYFPLSLMSFIPGGEWLLDRYMRLWVDLGPRPP